MTTLGGLGINDAVAESIENQSLVLLAELPDSTEGTFEVYLYTGSANDQTCVPTSGTCDFWVLLDAITELCSAVVVLGDATLNGDQLLAGGDSSVIVLPLALSDESTLLLTIHRARLEATITQGDNGYSFSAAVLGGAVRKEDLIAAIEGFPGNEIAGINKSTAIFLLSFIASDVDTDDDGSNDALSLGLKATGEPATILGVQ